MFWVDTMDMSRVCEVVGSLLFVFAIGECWRLSSRCWWIAQRDKAHAVLSMLVEYVGKESEWMGCAFEACVRGVLFVCWVWCICPCF